MFKRDTKSLLIMNISVFFTLFNLLLVSLFNVNTVFADTPTYVNVSGCVTVGQHPYGMLYVLTDHDVRGVVVKDTDGYLYPKFVGQSYFDYSVAYNSCPLSVNTSSNSVQNYYVGSAPSSRNLVSSWPVVDRLSGQSIDVSAIYYTFGSGRVDPEPVINFGQLKIGFSTDIAYSGGNQNAWRKNKDTIYFDRYDTLGNDLFGYNIELQAVPYDVEGSSQQNIISQGINDYVFNTVKAGQLGVWSPGQGSIDFTWEFITDRFSPIWWSNYEDNWSLTGWYLSEHWYRVGWAYRARLLDNEENVLIDWQWIYNGTSIDGEDVNNIINNNGLTPELVNSINNINNNNHTTNNNTYNNQVINYYNEDQESDGSWLEALLNGIFSTLGNLIDLIKGLFHDILEGLWDLIKTLGVNLIDFFSNIIDNIIDLFSQIDLTLPQFETPEVEGDDWFKDLMTQFVGMFTDNGIGFVIFIPLILFLIGVLF